MYEDRRCDACGRFLSLYRALYYDSGWYCRRECEDKVRVTAGRPASLSRS